MKKTFFSLLPALVLAFVTNHSIAQNWEKINTGYSYIFKSMEFPGGQSLIGFAGGQNLTYMGDGIVIKTTNGGTSWTSLWTGIDQGIEDMSFPDLNTGYVGGWSAYFAKTTNGGVTWAPQSPGNDVYIYTAITFKDANNGVVGAQTNTDAGVYVTTNGGTTWTPGTGLAAIPNKMVYVTANTYFLVTNGGHIQKSTDGGLSWITVKQGLGLLLGIDFFNPMIGMALGEDGWIHKTYDGGVTWTSQQTAYAYPLWRDVAWKSQNEVVTCGTPETIWRSMDGGAIWFDDYPASTYNPALYEIIYTTDGIGYICGSQGWFYRKAPQLTAAFTANSSTVCNGGTVQFTDQSVGPPTAWSWTFEGGTPSTSTLQNPLVTYSTPGIYDVSLTVTMGTFTNTVSNTDMIHVDAAITATPTQPTGPAAICGTFSYQYNTTSVANATSYTWSVDPATAGTITGNGLTGTLQASNSWNGAFTVKVAGANTCGTGSFSPVLNVTSTFQPVVYSLYSGGGYCPGQAGFEIRLSDSDLGVNYQLFKDGVASGATIPGTGELLSFGLQPVGTYTITGANGSCNANMQGASNVFVIDPPAAAAQPSGPSSTCNDVESTFTAILPTNGYTLAWTLSPPEAGTLTQPTVTSALITWNTGFSGSVSVTVQGENECGTGPSSPAQTIMVNALPTPVASGITSVCKTQEITYTTSMVSGSTYAWTVTGGTISSGQGTNQVAVVWGNPGTGTVSVTETSAASCTGTSPILTVTISECTGFTDQKTEILTVYPNPASDHLKVSFGSSMNAPVRISIYNHLGQMVYQSADIETGSTSPYKVDISNLNPGTYTLMLTGENEVRRSIFIKTK